MSVPDQFETDTSTSFENSNVNKVGIIATSDMGVILFANATTETMFGYSTNTLVGEQIERLFGTMFHDDSRQHPGDDVAVSLAKMVGQDLEMTGARKDGSTLQVQLTLNEIELDDRKIYVGSVRDNSRIDERQARLEAIMNNAVDAIITIDEHGLIDSVNPATESVFGFEVSELLGKNVSMLMPVPYCVEHDTYIKNYCDTGNKKIIGIGREVVGQRKDGSTFPIHLAVCEIRIGDRRLFTGIVRDISDVKRVEKQLAEMNEQLEHRVQLRSRQLRETQAELVRSEKFSTLGKVSGGIAHEIRNPLNAVKTSAYYLLNAKNASPEKVREHLERIDRQVMLIDNVITALSDVAKLPEAELGPLKLKPFVDAALGSIDLPDKIELQVRISDKLPDVLADERQLLIAFLNLIRNARDAMPLGGQMVIHATAIEEFVELSVADSGTGIPASDLEKVLEPLFTTKARGMGLGLPITRAIVEKNQGSLHVESELGHGSRFSIRLKPARQTE